MTVMKKVSGPETRPMLTHEQIWSAIDSLAERQSLTPSGLAKRAGLDPTTFNRSKRATPDGHLRWPSTESIAKVLSATGVSLDDFMALVPASGARPPRSIPSLPLPSASQPDLFDPRGRPIENRWDGTVFPSREDEPFYALEITGDAHAPFYRDGDTLIVSPEAAVRRGDRVVLRLDSGALHLGTLKRRTARTVEWEPIGKPGETMSADDVSWIARIVWASQ